MKDGRVRESDEREECIQEKNKGGKVISSQDRDSSENEGQGASAPAASHASQVVMSAPDPALPRMQAQRADARIGRMLRQSSTDATSVHGPLVASLTVRGLVRNGRPQHIHEQTMRRLAYAHMALRARANKVHIRCPASRCHDLARKTTSAIHRWVVRIIQYLARQPSTAT